MSKIKARVATGAVALGIAAGALSASSAYAINQAPCTDPGLLQIHAEKGRKCFANKGTMSPAIAGPTSLVAGNNNGHIVVWNPSSGARTVYFSKGQRIQLFDWHVSELTIY
jgi:hypothetical protein